jgi:hypothetical protein
MLKVFSPMAPHPRAPPPRPPPEPTNAKSFANHVRKFNTIIIYRIDLSIFLAGVSREVFALFDNADSAPLLPAMLEAAVKQAKSPSSQFKEK